MYTLAKCTKEKERSGKRETRKKKKKIKKEEKYLLVFLGCQDQSNERPEGSEIDETNCYGFCINNNNNTIKKMEKMEYIYLYNDSFLFEGSLGG